MQLLIDAIVPQICFVDIVDKIFKPNLLHLRLSFYIFIVYKIIIISYNFLFCKSLVIL